MVHITLSWTTVENSKNVIETKDGENEYSKFLLTKLVRTEENENNNYSGLEWYRSVVWDKERKLPLAISPRKSESTQGFVEDSSKQYFLEEFLEGTMLNLWALPGDNKTYCASRSSLGATGAYFSAKSFKKLLDEAWGVDNQGQVIDTFLHREMKDNVVSRFMSVVLRHPENRFVEVVKKPEIVTIFWGEAQLDGSVNIHFEDPEESEGLLTYVGGYELPNRSTDVGTGEDTVSRTSKFLEVINETLQKMSKSHGPTWQGLMLSDSDGKRWKFVSREYSRLRRFRSENRQDVRMMWLLKEGISVVGEYLKYFPEDVEAYLRMERDMKAVVSKLYNQYVDLHIKKNIKVDGLKDYFRPHVYGLHGVFINLLKPKGHFVRQAEVQEYLNKQPWQRVLFLVNRMRNERNTERNTERDATVTSSV